jgi:cytoskeleton protein RodZ
MTDTAQAPVPPGTTAGALLRAAREKQGVHIAVLAAAIKISPRKLDALEGDRYAELPDATFTRALAQTVCRALKIDSAPVMALLPTADQKTLDTVGEGLNTPFRDRSSGADLGALLPRAPLVWAGVALLAAAALVYYWPARTVSLPSLSTTSVPATTVAVEKSRVDIAPSVAASAASGASTFAEAASDASRASPTVPAVPAAAVQAPTTAASGVPLLPDLSVRPANLPATVMPSATGATVAVSEPVWLEVTDASGQVVFQRTIQPGETLTFDQAPPLRLKIGNSAAAKLTFRGEPVDLNTFTRGNVARLTLK